MDPSRSGHVLARHAGIDEETGQLLPDADGGPRSLVLSTDFYTVYESAGKKADGLVHSAAALGAVSWGEGARVVDVILLLDGRA